MGRITSFIICLLLTCRLFSQEYSNFIFGIDPFGSVINSYSKEEFGIGTFKTKHKLRNSFSISTYYRIDLNRRISINAGLAIRSLNINFEYLIHNPFDKSEIIDAVFRYDKRIGINPHLGIHICFDKVSVELAYEPSFHIIRNTNISDYYGPTEIFFDLITQQDAYFEIIERDVYFKQIFAVGSPVVSFGYNVTPKIGIQLTSQFRPYSNYDVYQLLIQGKTAEQPEGYFVLNDTRLNRRFLALYLGITYRLKKLN